LESSVEKDKVNILGLESPFYSPNVISIKAGEALTFDNIDANFHTVTSGTQEYGPDGTFDSGLLKAGDTFELTLDKPGTYQYYCTIHPNMVGTISVLTFFLFHFMPSLLTEPTINAILAKLDYSIFQFVYNLIKDNFIIIK